MMAPEDEAQVTDGNGLFVRPPPFQPHFVHWAASRGRRTSLQGHRGLAPPPQPLAPSGVAGPGTTAARSVVIRLGSSRLHTEPRGGGIQSVAAVLLIKMFGKIAVKAP